MKSCLALSVLGLIFLNCSQQAAPSGGQPPKGSCTSSTGCSSGQFCDLLFPTSKTVSGGTCQQSCDPTQKVSSCSTGQVCNPITATCEQNCSTSNFCSLYLPTQSGGTATCIGTAPNAYCALVSTSSCPAGMSLSNGFCKLSCSGSGKGNCPSAKFVCDQVTQTCEIPCDPTAQNNPVCVQYYSSKNDGTTLTCSPITATCVNPCNTTNAALLTCPNTGARQSCYIPGNPGTAGGTGSCEAGCSSNSQCAALNGQWTQCAEGVCQQPCSGAGSGSTVNSWRTTCDPISNAWAVGCQSPSDCTRFVSTWTCSPMSATCVPICGSTLRCPVLDSVRKGCFNFPSTTYSATGNYPCEVGCSGYATSAPWIAGTCATSLPGSNLICNNNILFTGSYVPAYCGVPCSNVNQCVNCASYTTSAQCSAAPPFGCSWNGSACVGPNLTCSNTGSCNFNLN